MDNPDARRFALLIGNNEFDDPNLSRLVAPPLDIQVLGELLDKPEIGGFTEVVTLLNQPYAVVRKAIARFFSQRMRNDLLLLYFSGHGILDENGLLHLAVQDTERDLLNATAIEASFITGIMDHSMSNRQVLVLDCCQSGAFGRSKGVIGTSVGTASLFEGTGYGRVVLTATDATQFAWDGETLIGEAQNSVFTHFLIQGLETGEADTDADGLITLDELYEYVYEKTLAETPRQTPAKWSYKVQGNIVLAQNPNPVVKVVPLPADLLQAIDSPLAGVREGSIKDLQHLLQGGDRGLALAATLALQKLAADDSRRVSSAAMAALSNLQTPTAPTPQLPAAEPAIKSRIPPEINPPAQAKTAVVHEPTAIKNPVASQWRPYYFLISGWLLGWFISLTSALLFDSYTALQIGLPLTGLLTGFLLGQGKLPSRLLLGAVLASAWSLPIFLGLVTNHWSLVIIAMALVGLVSSLVILVYPDYNRPIEAE